VVPVSAVAAVEPRDWRTRAACRDVDPELFFGDPTAQEAAVAVCAGCPVVAECRAWADQRGIVDGTWAGETEGQRCARLAAGQPVGKLTVCPQCGRGFTRVRAGQVYCGHPCSNRAKVRTSGRDCGTTAASRRHRKRGEPMDDACRAAESAYRAQLRARRSGQELAA